LAAVAESSVERAVGVEADERGCTRHENFAVGLQGHAHLGVEEVRRIADCGGYFATAAEGLIEAAARNWNGSDAIYGDVGDVCSMYGSCFVRYGAAVVRVGRLRRDDYVVREEIENGRWRGKSEGAIGTRSSSAATDDVFDDEAAAGEAGNCAAERERWN